MLVGGGAEGTADGGSGGTVRASPRGSFGVAKRYHCRAHSIRELSLRSLLFAFVMAVPAVGLPSPIHAQEVPSADTTSAQPGGPPPDLARVENARSRACVGALGRLGDLNKRLEPLNRRAARLRTLYQAIALEDSTQAAPFDASDSAEVAVRRWFAADGALGKRYAATEDSTIIPQRAQAKDSIRQRLQAEMDGLRAEAEAESGDANEIESAALPCQGAVLVRPAVLDECRATASDSQVCAAAADTTRGGLFTFVDRPADLWDIEQMRPWTDPGPIQVTQNGSLVGARTAATARVGNVVVAVALAPLIRERAQVDSTRAAELDANLDSLGFTFDVPRFVMAPTLEVQANLPAPLGGETHYLLHFGGPDHPDIVWSMAAGEGGVVQAVVPLGGAELNKLQSGEQLSLTAVRMEATPTDGTTPEAQFVYSVGILQVNEARAAEALLDYMAHGRLAEDLKAIAGQTGK